MKFRLYALKSEFPKGVSAGTVFPVGPDPVKLAFSVGAIVSVLVNALSSVPVVVVPVAWCHITFTVLWVRLLGSAV
jgi:hypothetical protein